MGLLLLYTKIMKADQVEEEKEHKHQNSSSPAK